MQIYSKYSSFSREDGFSAVPEWRAWYEEHVKCRGCEWPCREWQENPRPLDVDVVGFFRGSVTDVIESTADLVRRELIEYLEGLLPPLVLGRSLVWESGRRRDSEFVTVQAPRSQWVNVHRGPSRWEYRQCEGCGRVFYSGSGGEAIVRREAGDRPIVVNEFGTLYIKPAVAEEIGLRRRFPDIKLYRFPVIEEPLDGWTLPVDPDWDGVLRPPIKSKKKGPSTRGRARRA